ncbi:MAG: AI-2E family transporter [Clostridia bacterium]|nr:AI-2E family transporter [Clostridia bacterium]
MRIEWKSCFRVGISVMLVYLGIRYWVFLENFAAAAVGAAFPLIIGALIAYLVNILMNVFERHFFPRSKKKITAAARRPVSMILALAALLAILTLVVWLVLPELVSCVQLMLQMIPPAMDKALAVIESWNILPEDIIEFLDSMDWKSKIEQILSVVVNGVGGVMDVAFKTVSTVFSGIITGLLAVIFALYLLLGKDKLGYQTRRVMKHYLKPSWYEKIMYFVRIVDDSFHRFIVGQCLEAVILGALCTVGMLIFRFPYATMIGALIAFTALIPVAGAYIGAGVGAFMILTVSPFKALMFLIFIVVLQQLEGNIIYPRVVGSSIGLPGIWVLAAVTVGGGILGVGGMLVGVPLAAALYRVVREDIARHPKDGDLPEMNREDEILSETAAESGGTEEIGGTEESGESEELEDNHAENNENIEPLG